VNESIAPVSWGILSTAAIGMNRVIPAMQGSQWSRVDAIASRSPEGARNAASRLGIAKAYGSYEELLTDPEIEALYIPLPNHLHAEWALAAAEAGKHVLCEKPLAMSSSEARGMIEGFAASGVLLMEAFMYRLHPMWAGVMRLVEAGAIGEVRAVQTAFSYFNDDPTNIRNIPEIGGGALYDIGCYAVNVSRMVLGGEPSSVKSLIHRDDALGTDVITSAVLEFDGRHAVFICSTQLESDQRVDIYGTEGRLHVEIPFNIPSDRPTRVLHFAGGEPPVSPGVEVHEFAPADQYAIQADLFSAAIRRGTEVPTPPADAVANLEIIEAIFADAAT